MFEPMPALIRLERERQGLTQEALAKLAKISRSRLSALEKGDGNLSLKLLVKVAHTLGMTRIPVGGLHIEAAPPELTIVLAAADAIETARKVVQQATASSHDLERAAATVSALVKRVLAPPLPLDGDNIRRAADLLASHPDHEAVAETLRQLASSPNLPRARADTQPAAKTSRKRAS